MSASKKNWVILLSPSLLLFCGCDDSLHRKMVWTQEEEVAISATSTFSLCAISAAEQTFGVFVNHHAIDNNYELIPFTIAAGPGTKLIDGDIRKIEQNKAKILAYGGGPPPTGEERVRLVLIVKNMAENLKTGCS